MSGYRISKIVCPSCTGTGSGDLFGGTCMWCDGRKRMPVRRVERWSEWIWLLAGGGYIAGDHDLEDRKRMEAEANAARRLAGLPELSA